MVTVPATPIACAGLGSAGKQRANVLAARVQLARCRRVRAKEALGQADAAEIEAPVPVGENQLRRAATHVEHERAGRERASRRDALVGQPRLLVPAQEAGVEAVAPFDLAEEGLAVLGVADGARRNRERAPGAGRLEHLPIVGQRVADARERGGEEEAPLVHALAEAGDRQPALDLAHDAVIDVGDEQARRVRPQVDDADAGHFVR